MRGPLTYLRTGGTRGRRIVIWLVFRLPRSDYDLGKRSLIGKIRFELLMFLRPVPKN